MNEQTELEKVKEALILSDQSHTHIVEVITCQIQLGANHGAAEEIAAAMERMGARSVAAGMVILSTTISSNAFSDPEGMYLVLTVLCHWASREKMEAQARQNALLGGTSNGPRRA